ncbi:MAG: hypothetical protein WB052_23215, partial [Pseudolabrys sp.]
MRDPEIRTQRPRKYHKRESDQYRRRNQQDNPGRRDQPLSVKKDLVSGSDDYCEPGKHDERC